MLYFEKRHGDNAMIFLYRLISERQTNDLIPKPQ